MRHSLDGFRPRCRARYCCGHRLRALRFALLPRPLTTIFPLLDAIFSDLLLFVSLQCPMITSPCKPTSTRPLSCAFIAIGLLSFICRLNFLLDKNLERALRILDQGGVHRVVSQPSQRSVFQVFALSCISPKRVCWFTFLICHHFHPPPPR